jgi:hypothetical protein
MGWARFLAIALLLGCGSSESSKYWDLGPDLPEIVAVADAPNVVIILADDLGWRDVGYLDGRPAVRTRNIPRFVAD